MAKEEIFPGIKSCNVEKRKLIAQDLLPKDLIIDQLVEEGINYKIRCLRV